jgi:arylsulfatase A-like enzyme
MPRHNIIVLYADDLGFGDVGCYGACEIPTPNVDRLAAGGLRFHNGYATAATCTPSRYSLLTGSYPWRNEQAHILAGDDPMIIDPDQPTLPGMLREAGYATGVVGKWHLGIGEGNPDWNRPLPATPLDVGFDRSYIMAATNDRVPCVYLDGREVVDLDPSDPIEVTYDSDGRFEGELTGRDNPDRLRMRYSHGHDMTIVNGVSRIGHMQGGEGALWKDEEMAEVFLDRAVSFLEDHQEEPFFLYYALHQPHVPRMPNPRFVGSTDLGPRGDVIVEMDWCVGQLLDALVRLGLDENTIVIFSSDNGPVLDDGYDDLAQQLCGDHRPAGSLRGGKYSMYDGCTRVPFILRWPERVQPGESDALVSHVDFYASFARLVGQSLPPGAAPDSIDVLTALLGEDPAGRKEMVAEGIGAKTVLRRGDRVYIPPHEGPRFMGNTGNETGNSIWPQLYDLSEDISQIHNQARENPEEVDRMHSRLQQIREGTATRPQ